MQQVTIMQAQKGRNELILAVISEAAPAWVQSSNGFGTPIGPMCSTDMSTVAPLDVSTLHVHTLIRSISCLDHSMPGLTPCVIRCLPQMLLRKATRIPQMHRVNGVDPGMMSPQLRALIYRICVPRMVRRALFSDCPQNEHNGYKRRTG